MSKDIPPNGRPLSREEMLARHRRREYGDAKSEFNAFSRRALSGLQYHPDGEPLEATLRRLERRAGYPAAAPRRLSAFGLTGLAATFALFLAAGYFLFRQPAGSEEIFARHFSYLPGAVITDSGDRGADASRSSQEEPPDLRAAAMQAYEAENYEQAGGLMEKYLAGEPGDAEMQFYFSIVLLGEGKAAPAISRLEMVLSALPQAAYERPAKWYLALALIRDGRPEQAKGLLDELSRGKDRYATSSRAALKQLPGLLR